MHFKDIYKAAGPCLISVVIFFSLAHVSWTYASDPINVRFRAGDNAGEIQLRGIEAINLDHSKAKTSAEFNLEKASKGILWIRLFFPDFNTSAVSINLKGRKPVLVNAMNLRGSRNSGNIDVWHWVPVFRGTLRAEKHRVDVKVTGGRGAAVESLTWTESEKPWEEAWLSGAEVSRAIKDSKPWSGPENPDAPKKGLIIETEEGACRRECQKGSVITLYTDDDFLAMPFKLSRPFKGTLWFRVFLGSKNNYEGWTLDELANTGYLYLDGELKKTIWGEDGFHWRWYRIRDVEMGPGSHLFIFRKRGAPASIDKFVLYSGKDFRKEGWFGVGPSIEPKGDPFFQNAGYPEEAGPMKMVSRLATGFGVPGGGFPRFLNHNLLLLPGGEGAVTVIDVSDAQQPKIHKYGLNWYFNHTLFPFRKGFYLNSVHRGVYYVEGAIDKKREVRFRLVDMDHAAYGRLGVVFPNAEPYPMAITHGGREGAAIMDISHPLYPVVIGKVKDYKGRDFLLSQDRRSGGAVDQEGHLGLIDFREPRKTLYRHLFKVPIEKTAGTKRYASLVGLSGHFIFLRLGAGIQVFRRGDFYRAELIGLIDLGDRAGTFVRAYEYGGFIHIIDGVRGPGQYSIHHQSQQSKWHVYDPADLSMPLNTVIDPYPTAYSYATFRSGKAYVFDYNYGLWIFDLSDPIHPKKVGNISTAAEGHYLQLLNNDVLLMSHTFGGTLKIIDVRDPLKPKQIGEYWDGSWFDYDTASHTDLMAGKGTVLFLPKPVKGIQMIDFQNPREPKDLGFIRGRKCRIIGNRLYTIHGKELLLYDVSNERNPHLLGKIDTGQRNMGMAIDHPKTIWLTDLKNVLAVDVSSPKSPKIIGQWKNREGKAFWGGIYYHKGYLFGSFGEKSRTREIATFDVRNPAKMRLLNVRNWQKQGLHSALNDSWANFYRGDFIAHGDYLLASNYGRVEMYDVSDPLDPKSVQNLNTGFQWTAGRIKNGYLFVPTLNGLVVVKL